MDGMYCGRHPQKWFCVCDYDICEPTEALVRCAESIAAAFGPECRPPGGPAPGGGVPGKMAYYERLDRWFGRAPRPSAGDRAEVSDSHEFIAEWRKTYRSLLALCN